MTVGGDDPLEWSSHEPGVTSMLKTVEAVVEEDGRVRILEKVEVVPSRRVLVTFIEEDAVPEVADTALLSEAVLAEDWARPEEDEAWQHLQ